MESSNRAIMAIALILIIFAALSAIDQTEGHGPIKNINLFEELAPQPYEE